ncbi:pilus assembly protein [bacterium]|nr:pilus assembly protein [bacterium]MBU4133882.1 pilus assembly protein [bacterium]
MKSKKQQGQSLVEVVMVFPILVTLIFGIMQVAMIAETMFVLNDAANSAARAASVGKSATIAATYVVQKTIGLTSYGYFGGVSTKNSTINSKRPIGIPGTIASSAQRKIKIVECTVRYFFKPMFMTTAVIPLSASARAMINELPEGVE